MKNVAAWLYALAYCILATCVGAFVGAVAGIGVAGMLLEPQEAMALYAGVSYGAPLGALLGVVVGAAAMVRRSRKNRR